MLVEGANILEEVCKNDTVCVMYAEGILEHYFSEHIEDYNEDDIKWFIGNLNEFRNNKLQKTISRGVAKFFLKRLLTAKPSESTDNILRLFEDKVREIAAKYQCNNNYHLPV